MCGDFLKVGLVGSERDLAVWAFVSSFYSFVSVLSLDAISLRCYYIVVSSNLLIQ